MAATPVELAYFAGFFDGEGCVGIKHWGRHDRNRHAPYATVSQTRPEVLHRMKELFGGSIHWAGKCGKNGIWCWQSLGISHTVSFLKQLEPFLIVKKKETQLVLSAFETLTHARKLGVPPELLRLREETMEQVKALRRAHIAT